MLPRENRLKRKKDFERVLKKGKGFKEGVLFLKIIKNDLKNSRLGFVVSKRVSSKATIRNKIKRQLRNLVHLRLKGIETGFDGVLMVLPDEKKQNFQELSSSLDKILVRTGILKINR